MRSGIDVWVLSTEYAPHIIGGLGVVATNLSAELGNLGYTVTVLTKTRAKLPAIDWGSEVTVVFIPEVYSTQRAVRYLDRVGFSPPALIHIHSLQMLPLLRHYRKRGNIPTVYTCHSLLGKGGTNPAFTAKRQAALLRQADSTVVPSEAEQRKLLRMYPFCRGKAIVIPHGVKVYEGGYFDALSKHLLYAGRLVRNKGLPQLIDALQKLRCQHPETQLSIIGTGTEVYCNKLRLRARRNRVASAIHWLGKYQHHELQAAYRRFAAVVMPSRHESFGLVALEALAHGVPLVATRAGGLGRVVTSAVAQVIPEVDGEAIASAITAMWEAPELTRARVTAGKALALKYQWSRAAAKYASLFQHLCEQSRRGPRHVDS